MFAPGRPRHHLLGRQHRGEVQDVRQALALRSAAEDEEEEEDAPGRAHRCCVRAERGGGQLAVPLPGALQHFASTWRGEGGEQVSGGKDGGNALGGLPSALLSLSCSQVRYPREPRLSRCRGGGNARCYPMPPLPPAAASRLAVSRALGLARTMARSRWRDLGMRARAFAHILCAMQQRRIAGGSAHTRAVGLWWICSGLTRSCPPLPRLSHSAARDSK